MGLGQWVLCGAVCLVWRGVILGNVLIVGDGLAFGTVPAPEIYSDIFCSLIIADTVI